MNDARSRAAPAALLLAASLAAAGCTSNGRPGRGPRTVPAEALAPTETPIVYRSGPDSEVYHRAGCPRLDDDPLALPIDSAVRHLEPCSRCEPGY